jgi:hypothetical protein
MAKDTSTEAHERPKQHTNDNCMGGSMKRIVLACATLLVACAGGPPIDNPSAPGAMRPDVDERREARALEQAESECAKDGKHAVSQRVEGETIYDCAD